MRPTPPFPRLLDPVYVNDAEAEIDFDGPGGLRPADVQGDYSQPGNVVDADPRTITNLSSTRRSTTRPPSRPGSQPAFARRVRERYGNDLRCGRAS